MKSSVLKEPDKPVPSQSDDAHVSADVSSSYVVTGVSELVSNTPGPALNSLESWKECSGGAKVNIISVILLEKYF